MFGKTLALWLLVLVPALAGGADNGAHFYFVQITDTHFGSADHGRLAAQAVADINALPFPLACVVHTGDIGADNLHKPAVVSEARAVMGALTPPVHYLPGNHDILPARLPESLAVYTNSFGALCSTAEYHGVLFVMLYTEPLRKSFRVEGYDPLAWLEQVLRAAGDTPVLIFHHAACVDDFYDDQLRPGWPAEARAKWNALIARANVKAVIAGHFHRDELHWEDDVPLFVCAPIAGYWGRQSSYRIYEYDNGRLGYRTRYIERPRAAPPPEAADDIQPGRIMELTVADRDRDEPERNGIARLQGVVILVPDSRPGERVRVIIRERRRRFARAEVLERLDPVKP